MPYLGQRPSKGDENNFKILDDISSYTLTFDGSDSSVVSAANDTITSLTHRFVQGQRVTYNKGGGTVIAGLSDGVYYIIKEDHNTIKLATSASNAANGIAVNITGVGGGSSHTLNVAFDGVNTKFKATHTNGQKAKITRSAQLVISINGVIQQPHDTATPSTGFGFDLDGTIVLSQAPVAGDIYWAHVLTNNNVTFDISDNDVDNFTGDGSTVSFNLSKTPPDNRNVLVTIDGVVQYPNDPDGTVRAYTVVENVLTFTTAPDANVEIQVRHIGFAGATSGGGGVTNFYGRTGSVVLKNTDNIVANNAEFAGNLTVQGTMTTLDTKVTEVDQLEVAANNTTVGVAITQSGTGDILNLYDGSSEVFTVIDGGITKLTKGLQIFPATNNLYSIDGTLSYYGATNAVYLNGAGASGWLRLNASGVTNDRTAINLYGQNVGGLGDQIRIKTASEERIKISSDGKIGINTTDTGHLITVLAQSASSTIARFKAVNKNSNFDIHTDASSHGQAYVRNNIGAIKVALNSNGDSYFTGGSVGIGTENPFYTTSLDVFDSSSGTDEDIFSVRSKTGAFAVQCSDKNAANPEWRLRTFALEDLVFSPGGTGAAGEKVRIKAADGKVGIGTNNPSGKLDVRGDVYFGSDIYLTDDSGGYEKVEVNINDIRFESKHLHSEFGVWTRSTSISDRKNGIEGDGDELLLYSNSTEKVRIDSDGRVGIGTDNPISGKLQVQDGGIAVRGAATPNINFSPTDGGSGNADISYDGNDLKIISNSSGANVRIGAYSKLNHIVVKANGHIGIHTDNPSNSTHLTIAGTSNYEAGIHYQQSNVSLYRFMTEGGTGHVYYDSYGINSGNDGDHVFRTKVSTGAQERLRIANDGQATFDVGAPNSSNKVIGRFQSQSTRALDIVWHDSGSLMGFNTPGNHSYIFKCNNSEKLRITSSGIIGVNNANPNLGGGGDGIHIASSGVAELHLTGSQGSASTDGLQIQMNGTSANIINRESGIIRFYTGGASSGNERLRITSGGQILLGGTTSPNTFNGVGGVSNLVVAGSTADTDITDNSGASLTISNTDGTANNTAGLHFAREDTDGAPHYSGASVVAQFLETMNTGHYPKADLVFLTSTANNNAPSEKMRLKATGRVGINVVSPTAKLDVSAPYNEIGAKISGGATGYSNGLEVYNANGSLTFAVNTDDIKLGTGTRTLYYQRSLAAAINSTTEIVRFQRSNGAHSMRVSIVVSSSGFSCSKVYEITSSYNQTSSEWRVVRPISSTGRYDANFELLYYTSNTVTELKLRKVDFATYAGVADIAINYTGSTATPTTVTSKTGTGTDTNAYDVLEEGFGLHDINNGQTALILPKYHPSFLVHPANDAQTADGFVTYTSVTYNNGNHYKTSGGNAGKFIAPVFGRYFFAANYVGGAGSENVFVRFYINGSVTNKGNHYSGGGNAWGTGSPYMSADLSGTCVQLAKDDYVQLHLTAHNGGGQGQAGYMRYFGYLVG